MPGQARARARVLLESSAASAAARVLLSASAECSCARDCLATPRARVRLVLVSTRVLVLFCSFFSVQ